MRGKQVEAGRVILGRLSRETFAKMVGISRATVQNLEEKEDIVSDAMKQKVEDFFQRKGIIFADRGKNWSIYITDQA